MNVGEWGGIDCGTTKVGCQQEVNLKLLLSANARWFSCFTGQTVSFGKLAPGLGLRSKGKKEKELSKMESRTYVSCRSYIWGGEIKNNLILLSHNGARMSTNGRPSLSV